AAAVVDLPVVKNCRQYEILDGDDVSPGGTCRSNYCINERTVPSGSSSESVGPLNKTLINCSLKYLQFDIFVQSNDHVTIPGTCIKYQAEVSKRTELCSCSYRDNCTTSSMYPGDSGLPLDTRTTGLINCAMTSSMGFARKCKGHACFVIKR
ncbi:hypothetical protein PFISCL1PPCAC_12790, partial [Pristionchus fissidentatus]